MVHTASITVPIIGYVHTPYVEKFGVPRQPNLVDVEGVIEFVAPYDQPAAFEGLEGFSHLWLIWQFHQNRELKKTTEDISSNSELYETSAAESFRPQIRPPRLGGNEKIGVFASRSMYRPAPLGLSVVRLDRLEVIDERVRLHIIGADLVDGTPLIDIKPYVAYSDSISAAVSGFAVEAPKLHPVYWTRLALWQKHQLISLHVLTSNQLPLIERILALDPRPAYQTDGQRDYGMSFDQVNVRFGVQSDVIWIKEITAR
ncbi:TrmO family methyltransferase [Aquirhabdus sp.]|uniref:SAM-dependent methyltransferase n=1 Tax=Aquirhabdus sp. TaxID=2824160 RepID=UPI00396CDCA5